MSHAYYNENDPYAAQWLRNLIDAGHIAKGYVDKRSITDVRAADLAGYTQCHFFAGIGGWSHALRLAGWPDDRPVWTGSCPCQPFSANGNQKGFDDDRHLWPVWFRLIEQCKPTAVFGEQVARPIALRWLDGVFDDLEGIGYACGAAIAPACSVDAPHKRERLFFGSVGDTEHERLERHSGYEGGTQRWSGPDRPIPPTAGSPWSDGEFRRCWDGKLRRLKPGPLMLAHGISECLAGLRAIENRAVRKVRDYAKQSQRDPSQILRMVREVIHKEACWKEQSTRMCFQLPAPEILLDFMLCIESACESKDGRSIQKTLNEIQLRIVRSMWEYDRDRSASCGRKPAEQFPGESTDTLLALSFILARDAQAYREKAREAHAASNRVGRLRAYGNAIVPQVAAEFIKAFMEVG